MRRVVLGAKKARGSAMHAAVVATMLVVAGCGGGGGQGEGPNSGPLPSETSPTLARDEVRAIMEHAARAVDRDLVVAVTDRRGVILGVGANFPIDAAACRNAAAPGSDCAVASLATQLARTAAFFSADQTPLTSRSVRFISDIHFPPRVQNTGAAALFGIENTNRGCAFDTDAANLGAFATNVPRARSLRAVLADLDGAAPLACQNGDGAGDQAGCSTGIATLPGGVPIFKNGRHAGGVGVAMRGSNPGPDVDAAQDISVDVEGDLVLRRQDGDPDFDVAEFAARAFAGDVKAVVPTVVNKGLTNVCASTVIAQPASCATGTTLSILPVGPNPPFDPVIFIDGIEVPEVANNPPVPDGESPVARTLSFVIDPITDAQDAGILPGGWLIGPNGSSPGAQPLSADEVRAIIDEGVRTAQETRGGIRLPLEERTAMMLAVSDTNDVLLGLFRMDDATVFSIDVAVAKSRNVIWFSDPNIDPVDTLDSPGLNETLGTAYDPGTAITNRTLSFGAQPLFPSGIEGSQPGPFRRAFLFDSANPCTNGQQPANGRQNGIVFFPGSAPLYRDGVMIGGYGVSGDGVEQDDIVTNGGANASPGFEPPAGIRADQVKVRGVRLPYLKFNRQPNQ